MKPALKLPSLAVAFVTACCCQAEAAPLPYRITITLGQVGVADCATRLAFNLSVRPDTHNFGCDWSAGDQIVGAFSLADDTSSLADGVHRLALSSLSITVGSVVFDISGPSDLDVIRGSYSTTCPSAPDPATDTTYPVGYSARVITAGGVVTGFCEALRGPAGSPALYLWESGFNGQASTPFAFQAYDFFSGVSLFGTYAVQRVPEPASLGLAVVAMIGATAARRRPSRPTMP